MRVVVSADASKSIGLGHVTRALTLAGSLVRLGIEVVCVGRGVAAGQQVSPSFQALETREFSPADVQSQFDYLMSFYSDALIFDGYHFSEELFTRIQKAGTPYAVIDDNGETKAKNPFLVHNQNPHATTSLYSQFTRTPQFLLGLDFVLLRPEIAHFSSRKTRRDDVVVISFGGTDVRNLTLPVLAGLIKGGHEIAVSQIFENSETLSQLGKSALRRVRFFAPSSFLEVVSSSTIAVLGAGTSLWEANALKTPTVGVLVAENQRNPANAALKLGYVDGLVNGMGGVPSESVAINVLEAVSQVLSGAPAKGIPRVPENGSEVVANRFAHQLSKL